MDEDALASIGWDRTDNERALRLPHREARRADRHAIGELREVSARSADPTWPSEDVDLESRIVEHDDQIVAWMSWERRSVLETDRLPLEPWAEIEETRRVQTSLADDRPPDESRMHVVEFGWTRHPDIRQMTTTELPVELCQLHGLAELTHLTTPTTWDDWRTRLSPAAFAQQLHSGPIEDPVVTPMLDHGWRLDGIVLDDTTGDPVLLLRWVNPVYS